MKTKIALLAFLIVTFSSFGQEKAVMTTAKVKTGMIKVAIMYPSGEEKTFDMDYYSNKHMPMVASLLGNSLKSWSIDKGISGRTSEEPIPYLAIGYLYFNKLFEYQNSFGPNAEKIVNDIPNYTNIQPVIQISEVYK
ncbi:EthD family reductase [Maribacter sp. 2210JD10-5]|uniref:EthD family reductase n=1 Tax=Maribacter sp. 2210JD10-5 TaxID=3386272 RepID=UPI0039BCFA78